MKRSTQLGWAALLFIGSLTAAHADGEYSYTDIHPDGWTSSVAVTVNAKGEAAGYGVAPGGERGFVRAGTTAMEILPPGASGARVSGMNGRGEVAGTAVIDGKPRAFVYRGGQYVFPVPDWNRSEAYSIGEDGTVYGTGELGAFASRGGAVEVFPGFTAMEGGNSSGVLVGVGDNAARMLVPGRGYVTINPPGALSSAARGINESGHVALTCVQASVGRGYLFSQGYYILMTPPGWSSSSAMAVNNFGEVAGFGDSPAGRRGFIRSGAEYTEISFPGWSATEAVSVNDASQVAGSGVTDSGETHAFIASPAAEAGGAAGSGSAAAGGGCRMVSGAGPERVSGLTAAGSVIVLFLPLAVLCARKRRP